MLREKINMKFKYEYRQIVRFICENETEKIGIIERISCRVFSANGKAPYYDIYVINENCIYQDVSEDFIIEIVQEN